jgi:hypothetical protein
VHRRRAQNASRALACAIQSDFGPAVTALAPFVDVNAPLPKCWGTRAPPAERGVSDDEDGPAMLPPIEGRARPIVEAVRLDREMAALALLEVDAIDVNVRAGDGTPLIFHAVADVQILHALVKKPQLDMNASDGSGNTALHIACGALNIDDPSQWSTWFGARSGIDKPIRTLLENGADRKVVNAQGKTPWAVAVGQQQGMGFAPENGNEGIEEWIMCVTKRIEAAFKAPKDFK